MWAFSLSSTMALQLDPLGNLETCGLPLMRHFESSANPLSRQAIGNPMYVPSMSCIMNHGTSVRMRSYIHIHTYIHACMHTYMHTYIHTYIIYIYTYTTYFEAVEDAPSACPQIRRSRPQQRTWRLLLILPRECLFGNILRYRRKLPNEAEDRHRLVKGS